MKCVTSNSACPLRTLQHQAPHRCSTIDTTNSRQCIDYLVRQKKRSITLFLVYGIIPKAIEFLLNHPADIPPA
jgi:hypothetical protein